MGTRSKPFVLAVLIALLLHGLLLIVLGYLPPTHSNFQNIADLKKIQVHLETLKKQLVRITPPKEDKAPIKADYLAEFDNRVSKQTQAKNKSPIPNSLQKPITPKSPPILKGPGIKRDLLPTWQDLEQTQPQTAFNDHIEKVETDAQTQLNTFEWKYAAYFNRIKDSIALIWSPLSQMKRYDPAGALIGNQLRLTILEITIDPLGHVIHNRVKQSSGVFYLDEEAVRAFNDVGFFPHPPKALFAAQQKSHSFDFGFAVSSQKGVSIYFD